MTAESQKQAFKYETGQFVCHVYFKLSFESTQILDEIISVLQKNQEKEYVSQAFQGWTPLLNDNNDDNQGLHVTLLRGHRAVYYHQIKYLIEALKKECNSQAPVRVLLDDINIFLNRENTKQFLCLTSSANGGIQQLKNKLHKKVSQFATRLTEEDETDETSIHCSFMERKNELQRFNAEETIEYLKKAIVSDIGELPLCMLQVDKIQVRIGKVIYSMDLKN